MLELMGNRHPAHTRRVLMIAYDYPPSLEMGSQACAQIARYLPQYSWEPVVLTVRERHIDRMDIQPEQLFPRSILRTGRVPHPLTVYRWLKSRLRPSPEGTAAGYDFSRNSGALRRWVLSLLWVPDDCAGWIPPAILGGLRLCRSREIHHIFSSGPRWSNHVVALALSRLTGLSWTAHFRDPWSQDRRSKPVSALSTLIDSTLENLVLRNATAVVCVTENHTAMLRQSHPELPAGKFITIPNGYDEAEWEALPPGRSGTGLVKDDKFVITYAGSFYCKRNPLPLFRALERLIDSGDLVPDRIRVDLVGWCDVAEGQPVTEMAARCGLGNCVQITGPLSRADTHRRLAHSNLLLLLAEELTHQIPGKTYEYLRASRPILALTSEGALAQLLRSIGGAWVVDPGDSPAITVAVLEAYRRWQDGLDGPVADQAAVAAFDRRMLAGRFARVFKIGCDFCRPSSIKN